MLSPSRSGRGRTSWTSLPSPPDRRRCADDGKLHAAVRTVAVDSAKRVSGPHAHRNRPGELSVSLLHTTATISLGSITAHPASRSRRTKPSGRTSTPVSFLASLVAKPMWPILLTIIEIVPDLPIRGLIRSHSVSPVMSRHLQFRGYRAAAVDGSLAVGALPRAAGCQLRQLMAGGAAEERRRR